MRLKATSYQFEASAGWHNETTMLASSKGIRQVITVSPPAAMLGIESETAWSPEHLLLAADASCFLNTFHSLSENAGFTYRALECSATGTLELVEGRFAFTIVHITPVITLFNQADETKARQIADKAKFYCPISNSLKCPVEMDFLVRAIEM